MLKHLSPHDRRAHPTPPGRAEQRRHAEAHGVLQEVLEGTVSTNGGPFGKRLYALGKAQRAAFAASLGYVEVLDDEGGGSPYPLDGPSAVFDGVARIAGWGRDPGPHRLKDHASPLHYRRHDGSLSGEVGWIAEPYQPDQGFEAALEDLQAKLDAQCDGAWRAISPQPWCRLSIYCPGGPGRLRTAFVAVVPDLTHPEWRQFGDRR